MYFTPIENWVPWTFWLVLFVIAFQAIQFVLLIRLLRRPTTTIFQTNADGPEGEFVEIESAIETKKIAPVLAKKDKKKKTADLDVEHLEVFT